MGKSQEEAKEAALMLEEFLFQIKIWGYCVMGSNLKGLTKEQLRDRVMSGQLASICEGLDLWDWWDRDDEWYSAGWTTKSTT
jgi:hypothetical protein